jgi:hypothetical protein
MCLGVRRFSRCRTYRVLILVDALTILGDFQRGRSSALTLKAAVQRTWAILLAADVRPCSGYIPSEYNPGDPPSRGRRLEDCRWRRPADIDETRSFRRLRELENASRRLQRGGRRRSVCTRVSSSAVGP